MVAPGQFALQNIQTGPHPRQSLLEGSWSIPALPRLDKLLLWSSSTIPNGNSIGVSQMELEHVGAGTTNNFSVIYPAEPNITPALHQIIVYALR